MDNNANAKVMAAYVDDVFAAIGLSGDIFDSDGVTRDGYLMALAGNGVRVVIASGFTVNFIHECFRRASEYAQEHKRAESDARLFVYESLFSHWVSEGVKDKSLNVRVKNPPAPRPTSAIDLVYYSGLLRYVIDKSEESSWSATFSVVQKQIATAMEVSATFGGITDIESTTRAGCAMTARSMMNAAIDRLQVLFRAGVYVPASNEEYGVTW